MNSGEEQHLRDLLLSSFVGERVLKSEAAEVICRWIEEREFRGGLSAIKRSVAVHLEEK
jgi:hypothetical protein